MVALRVGVYIGYLHTHTRRVDAPPSLATVPLPLPLLPPLQPVLCSCLSLAHRAAMVGSVGWMASELGGTLVRSVSDCVRVSRCECE